MCATRNRRWSDLTGRGCVVGGCDTVRNAHATPSTNRSGEGDSGGGGVAANASPLSRDYPPLPAAAPGGPLGRGADRKGHRRGWACGVRECRHAAARAAVGKSGCHSQVSQMGLRRRTGVRIARGHTAAAKTGESTGPGRDHSRPPCCGCTSSFHCARPCGRPVSSSCCDKSATVFHERVRGGESRIGGR